MDYHHEQFYPIAGSNIVPDVKKIAVVQAHALGNFIFVLPALEALHATYPDAEIVLLARTWHVEFLQARPSPINRVIVVPPCKGVSADPGAIEEDADKLERFFTQMRKEYFDLALQLHGGGKYANLFTLKLGAKISIGLQTHNAPPLHRNLPYTLYQHEVVRYQEVIGLVGVPRYAYTEPYLAVTNNDITASLRIIPEDRQPIIVLHPGADDPRYRWPTDKFAAVGDALVATGAHIIVTGNEAEKDLTARVVQQMKAPAQDLGGKLSLSGLTGLLSRCQLVISNDAGPHHLASAIGTATVGIYWCVNMIITGPLSRVKHRPLISWRLNCPICGLSCLYKNCTHTASIVADIPTKDVIQAAQGLLLAHV